MATADIVMLKDVNRGDKIQIIDFYRGYKKVIEGIVEKINVFSSGYLSVLLRGGKDFYGEGTTKVMIEKPLL